MCAASQPETALHLNCKYYLWRKLQEASSLKAAWDCILCGSEISFQVADSWDSAEVEFSFEDYRIDVALVRSSRPLCAIEVLVTHQTTTEKREKLKDANVPVVEVEATPELYTGDTAWTPDQPLPICIPLGDLVCSQCKDTLRQQEEMRKKREATLAQQIEKIKMEPKYKTVWMRFVDSYYPSGSHFRATYKIIHKFIDGNIVQVSLCREQKEYIRSYSIPFPEQIGKLLQEAFEKDLRTRGPNQTINDSPMDWIPWHYPTAKHASFGDILPIRYQKNSTGVWVPKSSMETWNVPDTWNIDMELIESKRRLGILSENGWQFSSAKNWFVNKATGEVVTTAELVEPIITNKKQKFPFI